MRQKEAVNGTAQMRHLGWWIEGVNINSANSVCWPDSMLSPARISFAG